MKKVTLLGLVLLTAFVSKAQDEELKPFKFDISLGYAIPGGSGSKGGVIFALEPKYAVIPSLSVGLRMEAAVVARVSSYTNGQPDAADVKASGSYLLTADYYLKNNYSFRPFVGAGAGIFTIASATATANGSDASGMGSKFGGMLRAGMETGHFRLGLEYNLVPSIDISGTDSNGRPTTLKSKNGYLGIKIGVVIGGGRI